MEWNIKRWYSVEIRFIDLLSMCRVLSRDFETKAERQAFINGFLLQEDECIIQKVTAIDLRNIEIWERA